MATLVCFMAESLADLRKPHNIRVMSLSFIQGLIEDHNPGRQPLRSSEEIALKRQWKSQFIYGFWLGNTGNHAFISIKNRYLKLMILVLFCVWEDARIWVH